MGGVLALGITGSPIWTPAITAAIGVAVLHIAAPQLWRTNTGNALETGRFSTFLQLLIGLYVTQLLLSASLYGFGRAVGYFL